jgi:predicted acetyltransferase
MNPDTGEYVFSYLESEDDIQLNYELMRAVFTDEDVDVIVRRFIENHPTMSLRNHFTLKYKDKMVASLNLIPQTWTIEGIELKVAEMGCVATLPDHRHRGLQRILNEEFDKVLYEEKYDLAVLAGIPYFYRQFGFEYSLPLDFETKISLKDIPSYSQEYEIRTFREEDIPKASKLLATHQDEYYVHSVRSKEIWEMQQETGSYGGESFQGYSVFSEGQLAVYFRISENQKESTLFVKELSITDDSLSISILAFLKTHAETNGLKTLVTKISHSHPFNSLLTGLGAEMNKPYAWQIKIVDYERIFQKMQPLLNARLADSKYRDHSETLNFNFRRFNLQVIVENGKITSIRKTGDCEDRTIGLNPYVFPQILLGYRNREELEAHYPDFKVRGSHKELIDILFPVKHSYIHYNY